MPPKKSIFGYQKPRKALICCQFEKQTPQKNHPNFQIAETQSDYSTKRNDSFSMELQGKIFQILAKIHPLQITHFLKSSSTMVGAQ
jgi:hypothetical protein